MLEKACRSTRTSKASLRQESEKLTVQSRTESISIATYRFQQVRATMERTLCDQRGIVNLVDYKVDIEGKLKILHAIILTAYQEREASEVRKTLHEEECHSATVIEGEVDDVLKDEGWLELRPDRGEETYKDVNISTKLSKRQKKQVWELLEEYQVILTSNPGKTALEKHCIEVIMD